MVAGAAAAAQALTSQCGHPINWVIIALAVLAGYGVVYQLPNALNLPPPSVAK